MAAALLGCAEPVPSQPLAIHERQPIELTPEGHPLPPEEFRYLVTEPDAEASRLFELLSERPGDPEVRSELAAHYWNKEWVAAAAFIEATLDTLRGDIAHMKVPATSYSWAGYSGDGASETPGQPQEDYRAASEVCRLVADDPQGAVDRAIELLGDSRYSSLEPGVWAYAALYYIFMQAGPIEETVSELAFRTFVTAFEEAHSVPCLVDRAGGYWLLSVIFKIRSDPVSAYTAAVIEQELRKKPGPAEFRSEAYDRLLQQRIDGLRAEMAEYVQSE